MARLRTNKPLTALETVEEARAAMAAEGDALAESIMQSARSRWLVGTGPDVQAQVADFAAAHGVDEVMISPVAGSFDGEPMDASPGRLQTLELLVA